MNPVIKSVVVLILMTLPTLALAYIGPGAGLTAIGSALALVAAVALGIVGFVWYPVKRLLRKRQAAQVKKVDDPEEPAVGQERIGPDSTK